MQFITDLMPHQQKAVDKLRKIKVSSLFMEQGTGKTRTALELIDIRVTKKRINHVIWLCPCSVKENLRRDIIKHVGSEQSDLITICGIETLSTSIKWNSYLLELCDKYKCYLIVDESSKVKNPIAKRTKNILRIAEKCTYKSILNGTPITRNEADLYSQMYILDWRILGYKSFWSFAANHLEYDDNGRIRKCLNVDYLVEKIAPYAYQVKKSECLDLPKKTYDIKYFDITSEQWEHYDDMANKLLFDLDDNENVDPEVIYRFLTGLQLILGGYKIWIQKELKHYKYKSSREVEVMHKNIFFSNIEDNPRIKCLLDTIEGITEKCIIFCKYTDEINNIVDILNIKGYSAVSYNGELTQKKRQNNIDKFEKDIQFLVANKICAGFGLNLQFCSYVIFYSNDYDFGTRSQAEDRVHRIGQDKNVNIIDICAAYTLDERIIKCLERKENLLDEFKKELDDKKDKEELISWIRKKDFNGKNYNKKIKSIDKNDLKEVN